MKRYVLLLLCMGIISLHALIVKNSNVIVTINGVEKRLEKGASLVLEEGSVVCFKKGAGTVVLNNNKSLNEKANKCYQNIIGKNFDIETYLKQKQNSVYVIYSDELEKIGNKYIYRSKVLDDGRDVILDDGTKEILLVSRNLKNKPVTFILRNIQGQRILNLKCNNDTITFFKLKTQSLDTGYTLKIFDEHENIVLSKMIIKK
jgi:hypothetical protein